MRRFAFIAEFIIAKYLKQKIDEDLSVFMDGLCPCGLSITGDIKDLSMSCDQKVIMFPGGEAPYGLLSRSCFYCPNLITVAPVTRSKEICQSHVNMR